MATLTVTTNADSGTGSLRQAIADAASGDTITFKNSIFPTNKSTQISLSSTLTIDKALTFNALSGDVRRVTINPSSSYRVVISISLSRTITFKGFVFTSSALKYTNGGAISVEGSSLCTLVMQDCDFINISLQKNYLGGALYASKNCTATFTRCRFESLSVSGEGTGSVVYAGSGSTNGPFTFNNCSFINNTKNAIEIYNTSNIVTISNCVFSGSGDADILIGRNRPGSANLKFTGINILSSGIVTHEQSGTLTINISGYCGVANIQEKYIAATFSGSGFLAIPSSASITLPSGITRSEYGAGISSFTPNGTSLTWSTTNATKSVLLEKQNGSNWDTVNSSATSPYTVSEEGTYRIWDGETFLTTPISLPQTLVVTNTNDSGSGSLRDILSQARDVDTVTFDASLSGSTITLASGLTISNDVTIVGLVDANGDPAITISGANTFVFNASFPTHVSNVAFDGGSGAFSSSGGFDGSTFENCTFENMDLNVFDLTNDSQTAESVSFTDCVFSDNNASDVYVDGNVNATLSGGNILTEGFDLTDAGTVVITNANYNGVGGYTAPSTGTASVAGSGHIALPSSAVVTVASGVTRSAFGAGVSALTASEATLSWNSTDSTKSVLLEKQNDSTWTTTTSSATSPIVLSNTGTYRIWDGETFLSQAVSSAFTAPMIKTATYASGTGITITWGKVASASSYRVYYKKGTSVSTSSYDGYVDVGAGSADDTDRSYAFNPANLDTTPGTDYAFFVRAYNVNNGYRDSNSKTFYFSSVTISGTPAPGETLTAVIHGEFNSVIWRHNGTIVDFGTQCTVPSGTGTLQVTVNGAGFSAGTTSTASVELLGASVPTISAISNNNRVLTITWTCDGAHGYELYLVNGETMTLISQHASNVTSATYTASAAGAYSFVVKAKAASGYSAYDQSSATGTITLGDDPMSVVITNTNASGFGSLAFSLTNAVNGNIFLFDSSLAGATIRSNFDLSSKTLEIRGLVDSNGDPNITLSGNNSGRVFYVTSVNLAISDVIIANGYIGSSGNGAGVAILASSVCSFTNCKFTNNSLRTTSGYGHAVLVGSAVTSQPASASFTDCVFDGNGHASYGASGAVCVNASATFTNCVFRNNVSLSDYKDLSVIGGSATLTNCTFSNSGTYSVQIASGATLKLNGGNVLYQGIYRVGTLTNAGYNGVGTYYPSSGSYIGGSGHIALPSDLSFSSSGITASHWGAGISNFSSVDGELVWNSTDSTKRVLLEKQNDSSWTTVAARTLSPVTVEESGTYRIWDGATFLTTLGVALPPRTLIVTNTNNSGTGSLRAAIADARASDTITFDSSLAGSTITLSSGLETTKALEIIGLTDSDGKPAITISGNNGSFTILTCSGVMTLSNLVFENAGARAIYNNGAKGSSFTNCEFKNNSVTDGKGGAVLVAQGDGTASWINGATFTDCVFTGNTATKSTSDGTGGAVYVYLTQCSMIRCSFTNNTSTGGAGGAIDFEGTNETLINLGGYFGLTLTDCTFSGNSVTTRNASTGSIDKGGAIYFWGKVTALRCTFSGNTVGNQYDDDGGGAIYGLDYDYSTFRDCTFSNNTAKRYGGAVYFETTWGTTFRNCVFSGNLVTYNYSSSGAPGSQGGAIAIEAHGYSGVTCIGCSFTSNTSARYGGAFGVRGATLTLESCLFSNNTATVGNDAYCCIDDDTAPSLVLRGGNDLSGGIVTYTTSTSTHPTIQLTGYNGVGGYSVQSGGTSTVSGTGFLALPPSATITLPSGVNRTVYGAGISNLTSSDVVLTWSSTNSSRTVLLEKQSGESTWTTVNLGASSPATVVDEGVYRIWDGSTFLTNTVTFIPQTLIVTNTNDSGTGSLRAAIANARYIDSITFASNLAGGTITLASGLETTHNLIIVGLVDNDGKPAITISGANSYRILSGSYQMTLSNLIFTNGGSRAITNTSALGSSFTNCVFRSNKMTDGNGGALYLSTPAETEGTLSFTDCVFSDNYTTGSRGGALYVDALGCTLTMTDCAFNGNYIQTRTASNGSYDFGGALWLKSDVVALRCTFQNNSTGNKFVGDYGGAIYLYAGSVSSFTNCTFSNNSAKIYGGAFYAQGNGTTALLTNCTFSGNSVTFDNSAATYSGTHGGALLSNNSAVVTCVGCSFTNNTSVRYGGACAVRCATLALENCLFSGNTATVGGNDLFSAYQSPSIPTVNLNGGNDLSGGIATITSHSSYQPTFNLTGYNGVGGYTEISNVASIVTGSGYLALPTAATITLPNTVTRTVYGAGISAITSNDDTLSWTSVDVTKTVLLEKQNSDVWTMVEVGATSPTILDYSGVYRIWDGSTFLTNTVTVLPRTLTVTNANDSGTGSLRAILAIARDYDTIVFDPTLAGETIELESELLVRRQVTITGLTTQDGAPNITLDGGGIRQEYNTGEAGSRIIHATSTFTMSNVVIQNAYADAATDYYGAGVFCDYSQATSSVATISNCVFQGCQFGGINSVGTTYGMALAIVDGSLVLTDCLFTDRYNDSTYGSVEYFRDLSYGSERSSIIYGSDATVSMTRCTLDALPWIGAPTAGFRFEDCDVSLTNVVNNYRETSAGFCGGTLALNNYVNMYWFSTYHNETDYYESYPSDPPDSITLQGYNFIADFFGDMPNITGSGYLATFSDANLNVSENITVIYTCVWPSSSSFTGNAQSLSWQANGEVVLERQENGSWVFVAVIAANTDQSEVSAANAGSPMCVPEPTWPPVPDPSDPTCTIPDPQAPLIPDPNFPTGRGASPVPVSVNLQTTEPTTFRIWDGVNFQTTTIAPTPDTPQFSLSYSAPNTITASWGDVTFEIGYKMTVVKTGTNGSTTIVNAATLATNSTSYVLNNVEPNYRYEFSLCASGLESDSAPTTATLAVTTFTGGGQTIETGATLTTSIGYGANLNFSWSGTASSETSGNHVVTTADIASGHDIVVTATAGANTVIVDSNGAVLQSVTATYVPNAVTLGELSLVFNNNGGLDISWADTPNESSYTLAVLTNNATLAQSTFTNADVVSGRLSTTTNNNLTAGLYSFQLTATNDAGVSTVSASRYLATLTTTGMSVGGYTNLDTLRATLNYGTAIFRWYCGSVAAANLVYETPSAVISSTLDLSSASLAAVVASGRKIIVVATPSANTTILDATSAEFYPAVAVTPDLTATYNRRYRSITLSWQDAPNESSYTLAVLSGAATLNGSSSVVLTGGATSYTTNTGLVAGTYSFDIVATNDSGDSIHKTTTITTSTDPLTFTVTNTNDSGPGSLREAVANAVDGDLIVFDSTLEGETITLTEPLENAESGIIEIRGLVDADGNPAITLSAATANDVIFTTDNADLTLSNIKFGPGKVCIETDATVTCSGVVVFDTLEHTSDFELVVNGYVGIASSSSGTSQSSIDFSGTGTVAAGALESDCGDQAALEVSGLTVTTYGAGVSNLSSAFTLQGYVLRWSSTDSTKNVLLEKEVDGDWVVVSTSATPPTHVTESTTYRVWDGETFLTLSVTIVNYTIYNESRCNVNIGYVLSSIKAGNSGTANVVGYIQ